MPTGTPSPRSKQRHKLLLIEDAAQAFGATWNGTPAGALGDAAAFSFYPTKNLSAMGDAGLVTTVSAEIDDHARVLRAHGMRRRYYHDEIGWNSRLDSLQAAILEVKLRYLPQWNQKRRDLAARYDQLFLDALPVGAHVKEGIVLPSPIRAPATSSTSTSSARLDATSFASTSPTGRSAARSTTLFRCICRRVSRASATSVATFLSAKQLPTKFSLCPCIRSCAKTNNRRW